MLTPPCRVFAGGGPLGHPVVFINLDKPGPKACGYVVFTDAAPSLTQCSDTDARLCSRVPPFPLLFADTGSYRNVICHELP